MLSSDPLCRISYEDRKFFKPEAKLIRVPNGRDNTRAREFENTEGMTNAPPPDKGQTPPRTNAPCLM